MQAPSKTHMPAPQSCPAAHAVPQAPQFAGSVSVSTQLLPHCVEPPRHATAHCPIEQSSPAAHVVPQAPQFAGSFIVSMQAPLQTVPEHVGPPPPTQLPFVHVSPA